MSGAPTAAPERAPVAAASAAATALIVDAGHGPGPVLASLLAGRGLAVAAWAPGDDGGGSDDVRWLGQADFASVEAELAGLPDAVIFNVSGLDEAALLAGGGLADAIEAEAAFFLATLQAVSRSMIGRGSGQVWVLAPDDSFAYYLPLAFSPAIHHTRIGAVRALAKEVARFGVHANAAVLQPSPELVDPADWNAARAGTGSYAQKFRPVPLASVADTLAFWLACRSLPFNGSVIHFGNGVYDGNF